MIVHLLNIIVDDWSQLYIFFFSFFHLQDTHRLYKQKLEEVTKLQNSCSGAIARQRKKLKELTASLEQ